MTARIGRSYDDWEDGVIDPEALWWAVAAVVCEPALRAVDLQH